MIHPNGYTNRIDCSRVQSLAATATEIIDWIACVSDDSREVERDAFYESCFTVEEGIGFVPPWLEGVEF